MNPILLRYAGAPIAMHERELDSIVAMLGRRGAGDEAVSAAERAAIAARGPADPGRGVDQDLGYQLHGTVARVPIGGVIAKGAADVNGASTPRGTSTQAIREALAQARADDRVRSVLLHVHSPGGGVDGVEDTAREIRELDAVKPVYTVYEDLGASAAVWIGNAARRAYAASTTTEVGSIGVRTVHVDARGAYAQQGLVISSLTSTRAVRKDVGTDTRALSEDDRAEVLASLDRVHEEFVASLARSPRGVAESVYRASDTGQLFGALEAKARGLVDDVRPVAQVIAEMEDAHGRAAPPAQPARTPAVPYAARPALPAQPTNPARTPAASHAAHGDPAMFPRRPLLDPTPPVISSGGSAGSPPPSPGVNPPASADAPGAAAAMDHEPIRRAAEQAYIAWESDLRARADQFVRLGLSREIADAAIARARDEARGGTKITAHAFADRLMAELEKTHTPLATTRVEVGADLAAEGREVAALAFASRYLGNTWADAINSPAASARLEGMAGIDLAAERRRARDARSHRVRHMRLLDLMRESVGQADAYDPRAIFDAALRQVREHRPGVQAAAGHTTGSFPVIFGSAINRTMLGAFALQPTTFERWCSVGSVNDYRDSTLVRLSEAELLSVTPENAPVKEMTFRDRNTKIAVSKYTGKLSVSFEMTVNDDLGAISQMLASVGRAAALLPERLAYNTLNANETLADGIAFWAEARNNAPASGGALSFATLETGYTKWASLTGFGKGKLPIVVERAMLIVGNNNRLTAPKILGAELMPTGVNGADNNVPNVLRGMLDPVASSFMPAAAWVIAAPPSSGATLLQLNFLFGERLPRSQTLSTSQTEIEVEYMVPGIGAVKVDPEAGYRNPGA